jgi:hypothetical protein
LCPKKEKKRNFFIKNKINKKFWVDTNGWELDVSSTNSQEKFLTKTKLLEEEYFGGIQFFSTGKISMWHFIHSLALERKMLK